jgi:P-type Ca2+ transporter type 2C
MATTQEQPRTTATAPPRLWHALRLPDVLRTLKADEEGLSAAEAQVRLKRHGRNELPRRPPTPVWEILLRQFRSPLIYILLIAAVLSVATGALLDAGFILIVLGVNAAIGGYQEWRAERSTRALQQLLRVRATVLRDGDAREIRAEEVVPGDVVWLESGNRASADMRLLTAHGLEIDESLLTGESLPVVKDPAWKGEAGVTLADRRNMTHAGSVVIRGRAKGLVVATGTNTVVGQLALDVIGTPEGQPPLLLRMERFARVVALVVAVVAVAIATLGILAQGRAVGEMLLFAVAVAVSAVPESMPIILTVTLAVASVRMARRGVIVRRLAAVEGLGSCTLIASDKTGTLTCNELTVRAIVLPGGETYDVTGEGFVPEGHVLLHGNPVTAVEGQDLASLLRAVVLCNEGDLHRSDDVWTWRGDPTDIALLSAGHKAGVNREAMLDLFPLEGQVPFEPEHRYAATFHEVDGVTRSFVKGAPERVLSMCEANTHGLLNWHAKAEALARSGYRVLAVAEGWGPELSGLTFLGFVGMIDPLRHGARDAVEECRDAGIAVCMVTGDHPVTALAIARELGLASRENQVVTGAMLEGKSAPELEKILRTVRVFARVMPRQKLELVEAARRAGHLVAVTGDGVNDAPALRAANIGVAMGRGGTDVAREAAELVISDDNFATIVAGVEEGRIAYENVRKAIYLLISTGAAEVVLVLLALLAGLPLPLLAVQFLWLNLVTNGMQDVALALEPGEEGVLRRRPRPPNEPFFNRLMIERTLVAAVVIGAVSFATFWWMLGAGWSESSARNALLLLLVLFENIHIGNCRSETRSAFDRSPFHSPLLLIGTVTAQLLHIAMLYLPLGHLVLRTEPVGVLTWLVLLGLALTVLVAMELHKWSWRSRYPEG